MNYKTERKLFRIIDANFNRSREGLRVCEDIARFALNADALTKELKSVRHKIAGIAKSQSAKYAILSEARSAGSDIGRNSRLPSEMKRSNLCDIFTANIERVKESMRVLEEIFKLIDEDISSKFSRLRFKTYEIETKAIKKIQVMRNRRY